MAVLTMDCSKALVGASRLDIVFLSADNDCPTQPLVATQPSCLLSSPSPSMIDRASQSSVYGQRPGWRHIAVHSSDWVMFSACLFDRVHYRCQIGGAVVWHTLAERRLCWGSRPIDEPLSLPQMHNRETNFPYRQSNIEIFPTQLIRNMKFPT